MKEAMSEFRGYFLSLFKPSQTVKTQSVGAGKALFHISNFWLTGDVVPTVNYRN